MKQLSVKKEISYHWWRSDGKPIKSSHVEALKESAEKRIEEMLKEGFTMGELYDNIHMTNRDPQDGIEYKGWWEVKSNL